MKKLLIPLILLIGICTSARAQERTKTETKGDKYSSDKPFDKTIYSRKEIKGNKFAFSYSFDKAIDSYKHSKTLSMDGQRNLAVSYRKMNKNIESEAAYATLVNTPGGYLPEDYYNYAMVLKSNGKYDDANIWMNKFIESNPEDLRAKEYLANAGEFKLLSKDDGTYKIEHLNINSDAEDFGTSYYQNKIVFSSSKGGSKIIVRNYNWTGKPFWDLYVSDIDGNQLKAPVNFDKKINGRLHDGPASFSNDGTFMAFTKNHFKDKSKDKVVELQIFFSTYVDKKWSKPVPFSFNNNGYSVGQPCLSADGKTMYFTSDMPGGFGGTDIYKVTSDAKGVWGTPENLGAEINTEGDEMFPFVEETNDILFFTSNGHFGLGGFDIFICPMNGKEFGKVQNAGSPLNTQYDDFAVIVNPNLSKGYFSSNRTGGSGGDDIYSFDILKDLNIGKKIQGIAKDKDGTAIPNTFITLVDDKGTVLDTVTTKEDGAYNFFVVTDKNFKLTGRKEKYIDGTSITNTFGKDFIVKADVILLTKKEDIAQKIETTTDLGKIVELNSIYFDLDKFNIRPDAEVELTKIVSIMNEYPNMVVELSAYTDCRESKNYNQVLSDKRAKASVDYIKARITKPERITGKGFGETNLVNGCTCDDNIGANCTETQHQQNRRTEFKIVKK